MKTRHKEEAVIYKHQLDNWFTYHAPDREQQKKYETIRGAARYFAQVLVENTPEGADQSAAIRLLREAVMTANASIACEEPMNGVAMAMTNTPRDAERVGRG